MSDARIWDGTGPAVLRRDGLDGLLEAIRRRGFRLVGPVLSDGVICYGDISSSADLPAGWTDEQEPASYRLRRRDDQALFGTAGCVGCGRCITRCPAGIDITEEVAGIAADA